MIFTFTLALVWQLMRAYTLAMLAKLAKGQNINDTMIVDWVNQKVSSRSVSNSTRTVVAKSFKTILRPKPVTVELPYNGHS